MSTTVRAAASIPLGIEACWQKLRDLTLARHYVPGLSDTRITTEQREGVGASRIVVHRQFGAMDETVVEWDEGRGFTVRLHKGDKPATPFREARFRYALEPVSETKSEIHTSLEYRLPLGPLGRALDALFLRRIFRRNVVDTAVCLAEFYRTGQPVADSEIPRLRAGALSPPSEAPPSEAPRSEA